MSHSPRSTDPARRRALRERRLPAAALTGVLAVGGALTVWAWLHEARQAAALADADFDRYAQTTAGELASRIENVQDVLAGFQALFKTSGEVTRVDFHRHHQAMRIA
ncbi:MAG TPA: hypothetical protein PK929_14480, partial [Quisquiliibacterium sp.]|nr:hypothetical protein [Quisquiliibacterium sp.]